MECHMRNEKWCYRHRCHSRSSGGCNEEIAGAELGHRTSGKKNPYQNQARSTLTHTDNFRPPSLKTIQHQILSESKVRNKCRKVQCQGLSQWAFLCQSRGRVMKLNLLQMFDPRRKKVLIRTKPETGLTHRDNFRPPSLNTIKHQSEVNEQM